MHAAKDRVEYLEDHLEEIHGDIDLAREGDEDGPAFTALSTLHRQAIEVRKQLDAARPPKPKPITVEEQVRRLAQAIRRIDPAALPALEEALAERRVH